MKIGEIQAPKFRNPYTTLNNQTSRGHPCCQVWRCDGGPLGEGVKFNGRPFALVSYRFAQTVEPVLTIVRRCFGQEEVLFRSYITPSNILKSKILNFNAPGICI
jgi:hypothetical protein